MHLLIFDPHDRGHYLAYVRYLLREAGVASTITLVLRSGAQAALEPELSQLPSVQVDAAVGPESYRLGSELLRDFRAACERHRPDHVWVPSGDLLARHCNAALAPRGWRLNRGVEAECGLIELRFHRPPRRARGYVRHTVDRALLSLGPWTRLQTIDPTVENWFRGRSGSLARRIHLVPDPVDEFAPVPREDARRWLRLPTDGRYVVAAGLHSIPRKGSGLLLEAFAMARLRETDRLLLAGPLGEALQRRLEENFADWTRAGRILVVDKYLQHPELMHALAAADLVCTPYIDHMGSSAIALQAAQVERPVLAPHQGWFGDIIPALGLGYTGDILNVGVLARALETSLEAADGFEPTAAGRRLVEYSSASNFAGKWSQRLRQRMGIAESKSTRSWSWVLGASSRTS